MEAGARKIPYTPSQELRYELSEDEYSRKRFHFLMSLYKELQKDIPEVPISFSFFGSLVKGKVLSAENAKYADIDFEIKYDEEILNSKRSEEERRRITTKLEYYFETMISKRGREVEVAAGLGNIHFFISPINRNSIRFAAEEMINNGSYMFIPEKTVKLANYFTLSIGEAVKKYRNLFLKRLFEMADQKEAQETWGIIKECVERSERANQIPIAALKQFPQTLEEAIKFYEVRLEDSLA